MTKVYVAPERSLKETLEDLGSSESVNWRVYLLVGVPFLLSALTLEQVRFGGAIASWLLFGLVFWLITIAIIEFLFFLTKKRQWKKSRPVLMILILIFAGFIRGVLVFFAGFQLGLVPQSDFLYRVLVGPIFVVSAVVTMNVIVSNYLRDSKLNSELQFRQFELRFFEVNLQQQINQLREALLDKVNNQLRPELRKIIRKLGQAKNKNDLAGSVELLLNVVDQTVRPLSRDLALTRSIPKPNVDKASVNPFLLKLPKRVALGSMIPLPLATLLFLLLGYPSLAVLSNPLTALGQIAAITALNISIFGFVKFITARLSIDPVVGFFVILAMGMFASSATWLLDGVLSLELNERFGFQTFVFNGSVLTTLYVYQLVKTQVLVVQEQLQEVVSKLELITSALRQEAWVIQRNIATVLHGPVQAAMYSAAMRLSQASRPSDKLVDAIKTEINAAIARLEKPEFLEGEDVVTVFSQIQELWDGIAKISIQAEPKLLESLSRQPIPAQCAIEIAREGVSNAVKHGKAKNIAISIKLENKQMLKVSVSNDGKSPEQINEYGVGTALLNELSHSWEIKRNENQTELVAMVSLAKRD